IGDLQLTELGTEETFIKTIELVTMLYPSVVKDAKYAAKLTNEQEKVTSDLLRDIEGIKKSVIGMSTDLITSANKSYISGALNGMLSISKILSNNMISPMKSFLGISTGVNRTMVGLHETKYESMHNEHSGSNATAFDLLSGMYDISVLKKH
ncbi:MAG: hypothetical protein DRP97_02250, partial [Candidatus Latescibacterota bacterium]